MQVIQCDACAGSVVYDADREVAQCLFCGSVAVHPDELSDIPEPGTFVPFTVERKQADQAFRHWARSSWWYPREVRTLAVDLSDAMLPAWRFEAGVETHWAGLERAMTKSGLRPVSGVARTTSSVMVTASLGLTDKELSALQPFESTHVRKWDGEAQSVPHEVPSVSETAARDRARARMSASHRKRIKKDNRLQRCNGSSILDVRRTELMMLPIWIGSFRYRDLPWRFVINAQTGKVTGRAPLDRVKVGIAIALAVLVALAFAWWRLRPE